MNETLSRGKKKRATPTRPGPRLHPGILAFLACCLFAFVHAGCSTLDVVEPALADDDPFVLQFPDVTVESGKETPAPVTLKPKPGWKWNKEYPASAEVSVDGPCEATTKTFGKSGKSIEVKGGNAVFPIGLKGTSAGSAKVTVTANFSICNEETCRIFRKRNMRFPVKIK